MNIETILIVYSIVLTLVSIFICAMIAVHIIIPILKRRMKKRFHCNIDDCSKSFHTLKGLFRHIIIHHDTTKGKDIYYV